MNLLFLLQRMGTLLFLMARTVIRGQTLESGQAWWDEEDREKGEIYGCTKEDLAHCTNQLTRALDKNDLGFVTTELALNGLCRYSVQFYFLPH